MASLKSLYIFFLLHLCVQSVQSDVDLATLAKMTQYFDENVQPTTKTDVQYAIAIAVPQGLCTNKQTDIQTVFSKEEAEFVKEFITNGRTCTLCSESGNVIATRPTLLTKEHAEHVLLYPPGDSPMDKLLAKADQNSCIVFYSYFSPCAKKCLRGEDNILCGLENWRNKRKEINVFVFNKIWKDYKAKDVTNDLIMINNQVPLSRCSKRNNVMECQTCVNGESVKPFCLPEEKSTLLQFKKMLLSMVKS